MIRAISFRTQFRKHWEAASRPLSPAGTTGHRARVPICPRRPVTRIPYVCEQTDIQIIISSSFINDEWCGHITSTYLQSW